MSHFEPVWPKSLVLVGAGKMGGAMLSGWLRAGLAAHAVRVVDPHLTAGSAEDLAQSGVVLGAPAEPPEVLVLAIKPQTFAGDASGLAALVCPDTLVVSILAGKGLGTLRAGLPGAGAIVRAMPNLPAAIGRGATGLAAEAGLSDRRRALAQTLFKTIGHAEWLEEPLLDAVTAVSGSGPAYVFYLAECLAEAGVAAGLAPDLAERLARATVEGAGALMAAEATRAPIALRESVTSPSGTTAAALDILGERDAFASLLTKAVLAAKKRAGELAG